MRTCGYVNSSVSHKIFISPIFTFLIVCIFMLHVERAQADNVGSQCKVLSEGSKERFKDYKISASKVNCGFLQFCPIGNLCCRVGMTVWCCPSRVQCDYDVDEDWTGCTGGVQPTDPL